jgi:hypothetical protein
MVHDIIPGAPDSASKALADLKANSVIAQIEVDVLSQAVKDLKIAADRFATQIPTLEDKVKHLENKVVDGLIKVWAQEHCLERTT